MTSHEEIKVQHNVPMPMVSGAGVTKYPFAEMEVDTFFFLPEKTTKTFATYVSYWGRRLGRKFRTRTAYAKRKNKQSDWELCEADDKGAVEGVGVWRVG